MKHIKIIPICLIMVMLLSGCGSSVGISSDSYSYAPSKNMEGMSFNSMTATGATSDSVSYDSGVMEESAPTEFPSSNTDESVINGAKLIRDVYINMETTNLDSLVEEMEKRTADLGGYIQDVNMYNYTNSRNYDMNIRIPYTKVDTFMDGIEEFGTVNNISDSTRDITLQYADAETRLKNLNKQHERLLELLDKAENLTDVIELEARLSEVETEIDSYSLEIKNYDNLVNYSTISLSIEERDYVSRNVDNSLWGRIISGLSDNLYELKEGLFDFIVWFIVHIPNFIIFAIIITVVVFVCKKIRKKHPNFLRRKNNRDSK